MSDCLRCQDRALEGRPLIEQVARRMIVCPECGNKRCPKATWHIQACTSSNEAGQPGSDYPKFRGVSDGGSET